jgi:hypothetical protein
LGGGGVDSGGDDDDDDDDDNDGGDDVDSFHRMISYKSIVINLYSKLILYSFPRVNTLNLALLHA